MPGIELEAGVGQASLQTGHEIEGKVEQPPALAALEVEVGPVRALEVIAGRAVAGMHVLDEPKRHE